MNPQTLHNLKEILEADQQKSANEFFFIFNLATIILAKKLIHLYNKANKDFLQSVTVDSYFLKLCQFEIKIFFIKYFRTIESQ